MCVLLCSCCAVWWWVCCQWWSSLFGMAVVCGSWSHRVAVGSDRIVALSIVLPCDPLHCVVVCVSVGFVWWGLCGGVPLCLPSPRRWCGGGYRGWRGGIVDGGVALQWWGGMVMELCSLFLLFVSCLFFSSPFFFVRLSSLPAFPFVGMAVGVTMCRCVRWA